MKYRIEWTYLPTNYSSHGDWFDSKKILEKNVVFLNKQYKNKIIHKVVSQ